MLHTLPEPTTLRRRQPGHQTSALNHRCARGRTATPRPARTARLRTSRDRRHPHGRCPSPRPLPIPGGRRSVVADPTQPISAPRRRPWLEPSHLRALADTGHAELDDRQRITPMIRRKRTAPITQRGHSRRRRRKPDSPRRSCAPEGARGIRAARSALPARNYRVGTDTVPSAIVTTAAPRLGMNELVDVDTCSSSVSPVGRM